MWEASEKVLGGLILLYMITGKCDEEFVSKNRREKVFGKIIRCCCAYDPVRRYADVRKLEKALQLFLERRPAVPRYFWSAAAAVLCLICGWGGFTLGQRAVLEAEYRGSGVSLLPGILWCIRKMWMRSSVFLEKKIMGRWRPRVKRW